MIAALFLFSGYTLALAAIGAGVQLTNAIKSRRIIRRRLHEVGTR